LNVKDASMRFSKRVSKVDIKAICREYISNVAISSDELSGFDDCILKLITYKSPTRVINQLKRQYSPVVEVYANLDDIYNADISTRTACELIRVDVKTKELFEIDSWSGAFCATKLHDYLDENDINIVKGLSDDIKYDTAVELIAINDRDISQGYRVTWSYTIGVLKQLQGDKRVQDLIEVLNLKYNI